MTMREKEIHRRDPKNPQRALFVDVTASSLRNAELWIDDAKVLMKKSSFGHSIAALHLAREEISKALICWHAAEGMFPLKDNKAIREVFSSHIKKNQLVLAMCNLIWARTYYPSMQGKGKEPTDDMINMANEFLNEGAHGLEQARQRATYVNLNSSFKRLTTPEEFGEAEARRLLKAVETFLQIVQDTTRGIDDSTKDDLRKLYKSLPPEVWATGKIRPDQLVRATKKVGKSA
jgi:AbiV family abortive infection protein